MPDTTTNTPPAHGSGHELVKQTVETVEDAVEGGLEVVFEKPLFTINQTPIDGASIVTAIGIILVAYAVSRLVKRGFSQLARRVDIDNTTVFTLSKVLHYLVMLAGLMIAMSSIGVDLSKIALLMSAIGVGLGFGLQAIINNFVSGIIVMFERSLKIGDFVELESGAAGVVSSINLRSTVIRTNDNIDILVPNSEFVSGRVTNWTLNDRYKRMHIPFGVAYGSDMELVKKAGLEAAASVSFTFESTLKKSQVWLVEFGDSSLNCELVVWVGGDAVTRPAAIHAAYSWALEAVLRKYGLEIPFPQRDLNIRGLFEARGDDAIGLMHGRTTAQQHKPPHENPRQKTDTDHTPSMTDMTAAEREQLQQNDAQQDVQNAPSQTERIQDARQSGQHSIL